MDGDRIAYTFLADGTGDARSITWSQLDQRANELSTLWQSHGVSGQPMLLALASGLTFVESLLACWYAGGIAVPVSLPRHARVKHRLDRIVSNAGARFVIGTAETRQALAASDSTFPAGLTWLDPRDNLLFPSSSSSGIAIDQPIALLQYTSGSTGSPRGVVVTHANLMHNSAVIAGACGHTPDQTIGGWLPLFHDMGLIGLLVQAAFSGARCVFMSPERFLMRPWLWLRMISDFNICSSPAPNFAYDLCVDKVTETQKAKLNLGGWRNALNGSEPVRAQTLKRFGDAFQSCGFSKTSFFPCYGLAEATLLVSGPRVDSQRSILRAADESASPDGSPLERVSCGQPMGDTQLAIVNPQTSQRVSAGEIGEIWVAGASCALGYWNDSAATQTVFKARQDGINADWLRTGDLGFVADDQLFITGRIRELIIIAGRNFFPADLEQAAESAHPAVMSSGSAAFSTDVENTERLILAVELRREYLRSASAESSAAVNDVEIRRLISAAVSTDYGVTPHEVILVRAGALPRTTSGKIRRGTVREQYVGKLLTPITVSADTSSNGVSTH